MIALPVVGDVIPREGVESFQHDRVVIERDGK
jgi:hypothetical protein